MTPFNQNEIAKARIAGMHHEAERERIARAIRQARRAERQHVARPAPGFGALIRRMFSAPRASHSTRP
jgi:hypothetical protein